MAIRFNASSLFQVPLINLLTLWGDLNDAYHGLNNFGGNTAEIYSYRLQRYSPLIHGITPPKPEDEEEACTLAANALVALVEEFCRQYNCQATIDDLTIDLWLRKVTFGEIIFSHRAHVEIIKSRIPD